MFANYVREGPSVKHPLFFQIAPRPRMQQFTAMAVLLIVESLACGR